MLLENFKEKRQIGCLNEMDTRILEKLKKQIVENPNKYDEETRAMLMQLFND